MPYLKINYDDSKPTFEELELPEDVTGWLHAVHNILGCRTIQTVPSPLSRIVLIIDDDGKLKDGWENRINRVATILYGHDYITGDAILGRVYGDDIIPLTSSDVERLKRHFGE